MTQYVNLPVSRAATNKLTKIDMAIMRASPRFLDPRIKAQNIPDEHMLFQTDSPYQSMHYPTPYSDLLAYLRFSFTSERGRVFMRVTNIGSAFLLGKDRIEIPEGSSVAIPGYGMGLAGAVFALLQRPSGQPLFKKVEGPEIDPKVADEARRLINTFRLNNAMAHTGDMKDFDYHGYKVIYFYWPVIDDNFPPLIRHALEGADPGTIFILMDNPHVRELFFNEGFLPIQRNMPLGIRASDFWAFLKKPA